MRSRRIIAGIVFTVLLWSVVGIYLGLKYPIKKSEYEPTDQICAELPFLKDDEHLQYNTETDFSGTISRLTLDDKVLVIRGNVTITDELSLNYSSLYVEGVLNVEYLNIARDCTINVAPSGTLNITTTQNERVYNNKLRVNNFGIVNIKIHNAASDYYCYGESVTTVKHQKVEAEFYVYEKAKIEMFNEEDVAVYRYRTSKSIKINDEVEIPVIMLQITLIAIMASFIVSFLANLIYGKMTASYDSKNDFNASAWKYYLFSIANSLVSILSLGVLKPFADEYFLRWKWKHTRLSGQVLPFTAKGETIFFKNLLWMLLSIITLGIYSSWYRAKLLCWQAEGLPEGKFVGNGASYFVLTLAVYLISNLISLVLFFFFFSMISSKSAGMVVLFILFLIVAIVVYCKLIVYAFNGSLELGWDCFVIQGSRLFTTYKLRSPIKLIVIALLTLNIATLVYPYYFERSIIKRTTWKVAEPNPSNKA